MFNPAAAPRIETERLVLRPWRAGDFDAYAALSADAEVMRHLGLPPGFGKPQTRAEAWRSLAGVIGHWALRGYGLWAVEERGSCALAGRVGVLNPEGWPAMEIAWTLARPFWGKGYATEAARAARAWAQERLAPERLISMIHAGNLRSRRVAERLGCWAEGEIDLNGVPVTMWVHPRAGAAFA